MQVPALLRTPPPVHGFALGTDVLLYGRLDRSRTALERVDAQPLAAAWFQLGPVGLLHIDRPLLAGALTPLLQRLDRRPERASVVVPDGWMRSIVVDVGSLPRQRQEAEEVVRWRLKKLLPCRPEEVRLDFLRAGENGRILVLLALDRPFVALEELFAAGGVHVGRIEPTALALTNLLPPSEEAALLMTAEERTLTLVFVARGRVSLLRHKTLPADLGHAETFALRELARTLSHAREHEGVTGPLDVWVTAPNVVLLDFMEEWARHEQGVVVHRLTVDEERVPRLPQVETVKLWSVLATSSDGEA